MSRRRSLAIALLCMFGRKDLNKQRPCSRTCDVSRPGVRDYGAVSTPACYDEAGPLRMLGLGDRRRGPAALWGRHSHQHRHYVVAIAQLNSIRPTRSSFAKIRSVARAATWRHHQNSRSSHLLHSRALRLKPLSKSCLTLRLRHLWQLTTILATMLSRPTSTNCGLR